MVKYEEVLGRHIGAFTPQDQEKIQHTTIAIVGLGGTGSMSAILAAKAGFGRIIAVDKDSYELYNIVEQMLATTDTLGALKAQVAEEVLSKHGPLTKVDSVVLEVRSLQDAKDILQGADYLIAAVDEALCRVLLDRAARKMGVVVIMTANVGWKIFNSVHFPQGVGYEEFTRQFSFGKEISPHVREVLDLQQKVFIACAGGFEPDYAERFLWGEVLYISYVGAPAVFAASAAVSELLKLVTGKGEVLIAPRSFTFDLLTNRPWDMFTIGRKIGTIVSTIMTKGIEEGIREWKLSMGYS